MTRQNNEDPAVPADCRKAVRTHHVEPCGGGKGIPVNQQAKQLTLLPETAEYSKVRAGEAVVGADERRSESATNAVPKSGNKVRTAPPATMEGVANLLREAFQKVASNRGAPGPDGRSVEEVRKHLDELLPSLTAQLTEGTYEPGAIRRVWIPKSGGGQRGLGIPDVIDRMIQQAVQMVLEPLYEPTFHASSHGFRPGRSCHTAIKEASQYVEDGYGWVVDLDLKSFFDRVCHQRLMSRLEVRNEDRRVLNLIHRWLKAKVVLSEGM
jgi:retron-type reverse transcriptase